MYKKRLKKVKTLICVLILVIISPTFNKINAQEVNNILPTQGIVSSIGDFFLNLFELEDNTRVYASSEETKAYTSKEIDVADKFAKNTAYGCDNGSCDNGTDIVKLPEIEGIDIQKEMIGIDSTGEIMDPVLSNEQVNIKLLLTNTGNKTSEAITVTDPLIQDYLIYIGDVAATALVDKNNNIKATSPSVTIPIDVTSGTVVSNDVNELKSGIIFEGLDSGDQVEINFQAKVRTNRPEGTTVSQTENDAQACKPYTVKNSGLKNEYDNINKNDAGVYDGLIGGKAEEMTLCDTGSDDIYVKWDGETIEPGIKGISAEKSVIDINTKATPGLAEEEEELVYSIFIQNESEEQKTLIVKDELNDESLVTNTNIATQDDQLLDSIYGNLKLNQTETNGNYGMIDPSAAALTVGDLKAGFALTLAPEEYLEFSFKVRVNPTIDYYTLHGGTDIYNQATVCEKNSTATDGTDCTEIEGLIPTDPISLVNLGVKKSVKSIDGTQGSHVVNTSAAGPHQITYQVKYTNDGDEAVDAVLKDSYSPVYLEIDSTNNGIVIVQNIGGVTTTEIDRTIDKLSTTGIEVNMPAESSITIEYSLVTTNQLDEDIAGGKDLTTSELLNIGSICIKGTTNCTEDEALVGIDQEPMEDNEKIGIIKDAHLTTDGAITETAVDGTVATYTFRITNDSKEQQIINLHDPLDDQSYDHTLSDGNSLYISDEPLDAAPIASATVSKSTTGLTYGRFVDATGVLRPGGYTIMDLRLENNVYIEVAPQSETYISFDMSLTTKGLAEGVDDIEDVENTVDACLKSTTELYDDCTEAGHVIEMDITPALSVQKTSDKDTSGVNPGQTIHYTIKVSNEGNVGLYDVKVKDEILDTNLDLATIASIVVKDNIGTPMSIGTNLDQYQEDFTNNQVIINNIKVGEFVTIEFDIDVVDHPTLTVVDKNIDNTVQACFTVVNEQCISDDNNINIHTPSVAITKEADKVSVDPSGQLIYTIKVVNDGDVDLTDLEITDTISDVNLDKATVVDVTASYGSAQYVEPTIIWTIDSLAVGEEQTLTFKINVLNDVDITDVQVNNSAQVCALQMIDCNNADSKVDLNLISGLEVVKTADKEVDGVGAGDVIHYTIKVTNTGNFGMEEVKVQDPLKNVAGGDDRLDSSTIANIVIKDNAGAPMTTGTGVDQYQEDFANDQVIINYIAKAQYITVEFDIDVKADAKPTLLRPKIVNSAEACYNASLPICANDDVKVSLNEPSLDVTKTSSVTSGSPKAMGDTIMPGYTVGYTITATNTGNTDLTNVVLTDDISTFTDSFEPGSIVIEDGGTKNPLTNVITWNISTLAKGESKDVHFSAVASRSLEDDSTLINEACGVSDEVASKVCGQIENPTDVRKDIVLEKEAVSASVVPGGTAQYTLTLANLSDIDLDDVIITDPLNDVGFDRTNIIVDSIVSDLEGILTEGTNYTVDTSDGLTIQMLTSFKYTDILTITFTVGISNTVVDGQVIPNTAEACIEAKTICDEGSANVTGGIVSLLVDKTVDQHTAEVGTGSLTYTISVTNDSSTDVSNVYLSDNIDDEFWDGEVGSADVEGVGSGNLDNSTLELVSVTDKDMSPITNYTITEPTDYDTEDYVVYFPTVPAKQTYIVTYTIDQTPWLNGPTYNNTYHITIQDRFDDYLIPNKVTGYYDKDGNLELTDAEVVGSKVVRTRLAAVYNEDAIEYTAGNMPSAIHTWSIGLTSIITENTLERFGGLPLAFNNTQTHLLPGEYNVSGFGVDSLSQGCGFTVIVNKVQYPVSGEYKDFVNYTTSGMIDPTATPLYEDTFGSASTKGRDLKNNANEFRVYVYLSTTYGDTGNNLP